MAPVAYIVALATLQAVAAMSRNHLPLAQHSLDSGRQLPSTSEGGHYWPHVRGHVGAYGTTGLTGPNLTANFSWSWHHPDGRYHTIMLGGAILDSEKNAYVATEDGIFKLSPSGQQLWHYNATVPMTTVPSLNGNLLFGSSTSGWYFALDIETGIPAWSHKYADEVSGDTGYVEAHSGVVVAGMNVAALPQMPGTKTVIGMNTSTGDKLWEYTPEFPVWNVMALFPDDDTTVFMDYTGGVHRLGLHNGTLLWHKKAPGADFSFSDGGLILGPDNDVYACSNPAQSRGNEGEYGVLNKYRLADGGLLWSRELPYPCNSWPAVSADNRMVVVVPGSFATMPVTMTAVVTGLVQPAEAEAFHLATLAAGEKQRSIANMADLRAQIAAFDAGTGEPLWTHAVPPLGRVAFAGDEEGWLTRKALGHREICLPAHWTAPTIDADGTVYVGRSDGKMYKYSPATGESTFTTGTAGLHSGMTFAPGMAAYADCDSVYVWNW